MNRFAMIALAPLSELYGLAMKTRRLLYRQKIFPTCELGAPVISVGNLTTGGTGKTPLVEWIAKQLAKKNRRVCVLTRGYGRVDENTRVVVSDGKQVLSTPDLAGDEPFLLAERLRGKSAVISDANRERAARWAAENLQPDVFLLDDGFQHLRIARNLDIVAIDATNPYGNGRVLPAGTLREPLSELSRADCVVITRAEHRNRNEELSDQIAEFTDQPILLSRMTVSDLRLALTSGAQNRQPLTMDQIKGMGVAAFCGTGNPQAFFDQLKRDGYDLADAVSFRDHHIYTQTDIDRLSREAIAKGAKVLLTTAKDEVKLRLLIFDLPCYVVDIAIELDDENKMIEMIDAAVSESPAGS